jgi:hypothetical protein
MSLKLKALSLGLLAAVAMSAVFVANAGATRSGHFTSDSPSGSTTIVGHETTGTVVTHKIEFDSPSLEGVAKPIICKHGAYHGSISVPTTQEIRVKPTWSGCETTPLDTAQPVTVHTNNCELKFTSRTNPDGKTDATAGLVCPVGQKIRVTNPHNGCTLSFGSQTIANAVTYDTTVENGKHAITLNATAVGIHFTTHGGACIFLPTTHTDGTMKGSATVTGINPVTSLPVNITAT